MRKKIIGVMGSGRHASAQEVVWAEELGKGVAQNGWYVLSGGRNSGVMDAVSKGAKEAGGFVIGILPRQDDENASDFLDVAIITGMGSVRNNINVLTSDVIVACGHLAAGTLSEVALALKAKKPVILLGVDEDAKEFLHKIGGDLVSFADSPQEVIEKIRVLF